MSWRLLFSAEPFGFGPTAAIAAFFPHIHKKFPDIGFIGERHALDLQRGLPYRAIHDSAGMGEARRRTGSVTGSRGGHRWEHREMGGSGISTLSRQGPCPRVRRRRSDSYLPAIVNFFVWRRDGGSDWLPRMPTSWAVRCRAGKHHRALTRAAVDPAGL